MANKVMAEGNTVTYTHIAASTVSNTTSNSFTTPCQRRFM
jgi:hypothetical protein